MPYSVYLPQNLVPQWMRRPWWTKFWIAIGAVLDMVTTAAKYAVKARFPDPQFAATDALDAQGGERILPRGRTGAGPESDAGFASRLVDAWNIWYWGGTAYGLLTALRTAGYPTAILETVGGWQYSLDGGGNLVIVELLEVSGLLGTWLVRGSRSYWSEFSVVFSQPSLPTPATGSVSDWTVALPAGNSIEVANLVSTVKKWRPAFAYCAGITAITAGRSWGYPPNLSWFALGPGYGYDYQHNATTTFPVDGPP